MFICDPCMEKRGIWGIPISYGSCEDCHTAKACADIHHSQLPPIVVKIEEEKELPVFESEGWFTHWVCPGCGHNDWDEGDIRGEEIACTNCGLHGIMPSD